MRKWLIASLLGIVILLQPSAPIAMAQTSPYDWCYTFNFNTSNYSAQWATAGSGYGSYSSGAWQGQVSTIGGTEAERLSLTTEFDTAATVSAATITIETQSGWSETFDFTTSSHGLIGGFGTSATTGRAFWVSGQGFKRNDGDPTRFEVVTGQLIRGNINEVTADFSRTVTLTSSGSLRVHKILGNVSSRPQSVDIFTASQTIDDFTRAVTMNFNGNERFSMGGAPSSSFVTPTFPADFYLRSLTLSGGGLNPFTTTTNPTSYDWGSTVKYLPTATSSGTYTLVPDSGTRSEFNFIYENTEYGDTRYRVTKIELSGMGDAPYSSIANACEDDDTPRWYAPLANVPERVLFVHDGLSTLPPTTLAGVTLADQPVFAATDGDVIGVSDVLWQPLNTDEYIFVTPCPFIPNEVSPGTIDTLLVGCTFFAPFAITGVPDVEIEVTNYTPSLSAFTASSAFSTSASRQFQIVTIQTDDGYRLRYYVYDARASLGDRITAGCRLGKTTNPSNTRGIVAVIAEEVGVPFDAQPFYSQEPDPNASDCNTPAGYESCIGGGYLANSATQKLWITSGEVVWQIDRVTLSPGASLSISTEVDLSSDPVLWVYGRGVGGDAFNVVLSFSTMNIAERGQTITMFPGYAFQQRSVAPTGGDGYEVAQLKLRNNAEIPLQIQSFCVLQNDEEGNPQPPPPDESDTRATCKFVDSDFDVRPSPWTYSGGAVHNFTEALLPDGGIISQTGIAIDGSVYLTLAVSLKYDNDFLLSSGDPLSNVVLEMRHNGGSWVTIGTLKLGDFVKRNNHYIVEYSYSATTSGTYEIRATMNDLPDAIKGVAIKSACISESQYDEDGLQLFPQRCNVEFGIPSGQDTSTWTQWLWANQWQFYNCQLMVLLNSMYNLMIDAFNTWGRMARYNMLLFRVTMAWLGSDVFPWLDGHFANIARGTVTNVTTISSCDNIFCFFESIISGVISPLIALLQSILDILAGVFNFALGVLTQFTDVAFGLFDWLFSLIENLTNLIGVVLGLWDNTAPADLPFIPSCSTDPKADMICIMFWMMENTIFSGAGSSLIPLWISFGTLMALLWAIKKLRNAISTAGAAL